MIIAVNQLAFEEMCQQDGNDISFNFLNFIAFTWEKDKNAN